MATLLACSTSQQTLLCHAKLTSLLPHTRHTDRWAHGFSNGHTIPRDETQLQTCKSPCVVKSQLPCVPVSTLERLGDQTPSSSPIAAPTSSFRAPVQASFPQNRNKQKATSTPSPARSDQPRHSHFPCKLNTNSYTQAASINDPTTPCKLARNIQRE